MTAELPDFVALKKRYNAESFSPGARAELRRVSKPDELALVPALYRLFPGQRPDIRHRRLAYFLPYCEHNDSAKSLGSQLADAGIAEARILQVARSRDPLDMVQFRRLLTHVKPEVDWAKFGQMVWYWNERSKREFVETFYIARFATGKGENK